MDLDGIPQLQDERKFDDTLGALLIGGLLTMAMWGFLCSQTFTFFKQNTKNGLIVKLVVFFLWALEALHSGLVMHLLYIYLVSNYLNPTVLSYSSWCLSVLAAITTLSNFIVRSMFTWRYYRLTRETPFTLFISALSATDVVTRLLLIVKGFFATFQSIPGLQGLFYTAFVSNVCSNFSLFLGLSTVFRPSRMVPSRMDVMINSLIVYSLDTGLLVVIDSVVALIAYAAIPNKITPLASYLILSKLFFISYLAMLNGRDLLRCKGKETLSVHLNNFPVTQTQIDYGWQEEKTHPETMPIAVHTSVETRVTSEPAASPANAFKPVIVQ